MGSGLSLAIRIGELPGSDLQTHGLLTISTYPWVELPAWVSLVMSPRLTSVALAIALVASACAPRYVDADYAISQPSGPYRLASGDR